MKKVEIYERPLCWQAETCGPVLERELTELQDTILNLKSEGIEVERIQIDQQLKRFLNNPIALSLLKSDGYNALPLTFVDGELFIKDRYPRYDDLCKK